MTPVAPGGWIPFGFIARAHGVRGELRLAPLHPDAELPEGVERLRLCPRRGPPVVLAVRSVRPTHGALLVTLAEVTDRDAAQALAGAQVEIEATSLPPLAPGEVYVYELIGAAARDEEGRELGTVAGLVDNHGQDVLVLRGNAGEERLLPFLSWTLVRFDRAATAVVLRVPAGLWED